MIHVLYQFLHHLILFLPDPPDNLDLPISLRKDSIFVPKTVKEALNHPRWFDAMLEEIHALEDNHIWDLVDLPKGKKLVVCKWVFAVKVNLDGFVARLKARLVAKGRKCIWSNHPVLLLRGGSDYAGISSLKSFLHTRFHTKDLGQLKYFLGVEVTRSKKEILLSQRNYILDLLAEIGKLVAKPCSSSMVPNVHLMKDDADPFDDPTRYRRLVGKLNYLIVTRPDIAFAVSVISQFMSAPTVKHWAALEQILCYLKGAPRLGILYSNHNHTRIEYFADADWAGSKIDRRSTTGYCVFVEGNLVSWRSKKQSVVSRSSAESEYRVMSQSTCEIIWIHHLLTEIGLKHPILAKF
ncbi:uncharacterized mitochondrial protein AtMg00810-like [Nicotiana sylvestris]|uniref:uncharacterized mitochondrial protein AtMg00810-like n=1 Tax=Nicotiana sylvestris TaxID=4096 RepID=UPI00388C4838